LKTRPDDIILSINTGVVGMGTTTAFRMDLGFNQVLSLVRQLPKKDKIRLSSELEKEAIDSKLGELLRAFKTDDLPMDTITEGVEQVRSAIYARKRRHADCR
jgi:hypothetical protein